MSTLAPERTMLPLSTDVMEHGRATAGRPFGLTLATPSTSTGVLDLTDAHYDPHTQTLVGVGGDPVAGKDTINQVNTPYTTQHDHSRFSDNKADTYRD